jgi:putative zinc finger/helix-turn-helix YgiT family protein
LEKSTEAVDREYAFEGRSVAVSLPAVPVLRCRSCQEVLFGLEADEALTAEFRRLTNLLSPTQIRALRKALGYTQEELAGIMRIAAESISRWECGHVIQSGGMDTLLRVVLNVSEARRVPARLSPLEQASLTYKKDSTGWASKPDVLTSGKPGMARAA